MDQPNWRGIERLRFTSGWRAGLGRPGHDDEGPSAPVGLRQLHLVAPVLEGLRQASADLSSSSALRAPSDSPPCGYPSTAGPPVRAAAAVACGSRVRIHGGQIDGWSRCTCTPTRRCSSERAYAAISSELLGGETTIGSCAYSARLRPPSKPAECPRRARPAYGPPVSCRPGWPRSDQDQDADAIAGRCDQRPRRRPARPSPAARGGPALGGAGPSGSPWRDRRGWPTRATQTGCSGSEQVGRNSTTGSSTAAARPPTPPQAGR